MVVVVEGRARGKGYVYRIHFLVQETLTQHCKVTVLQRGKRKHYNALILKKQNKTKHDNLCTKEVIVLV